jgi:benzil reductase ((S)-benzoin forming)
MTPHLYILTGGSRGMGAAMAQQLLQPGHWLISIARSTQPGLDALAAQHGARLAQWQHDLAAPQAAAAQLQALLESLATEPPASATLINNAAALSSPGPLEQTGDADTVRALRVGLEAPVLLTAAFLRATAAWTVPRRILNISSGLGRRAMAGSSSYCAVKAGLDHFSRSIALDEASKPHGARICSLAPGVIDTDMQLQLRSADPTRFASQATFAALKENSQLSSPADAAKRVLECLARADFGVNVVADVRD